MQNKTNAYRNKRKACQEAVCEFGGTSKLTNSRAAGQTGGGVVLSCAAPVFLREEELGLPGVEEGRQ